MRRVEWSPLYDSAGPCESAAFNQLRFEGGRIEASPATLAGQGDYTVLRYVPPSHWNRAGEVEEIGIASFALPETRYGDRRINHALAFYLPRGDARDAFAECMADNVATHGVDGDFQQLVSPELITTRWLGVMEANSVYCGGAHPSHWQQRRVFDRNRGVEVDPSRWLNESALTRELYASGEDSDTFATVSVEFREAIRPHWLADADGECIDIVMEATGWDVGLARDGLALIPSLPHVATNCAETVILPWASAAPFLTAEGQAVRLSLEASD